MSNKINYNFDISKQAMRNLEEISRSMNHNIISKEDQYMSLLTNSWDSESSYLYRTKLDNLINNYKSINTDLQKQIENIARLSRKMRFIEDEAKRIAQENKQ